MSATALKRFAHQHPPKPALWLASAPAFRDIARELVARRIDWEYRVTGQDRRAVAEATGHCQSAVSDVLADLRNRRPFPHPTTAELARENDGLREENESLRLEIARLRRAGE